MHEAEVNSAERVRVVEEEDVLVGAPDGFLEVPLGPLQVLVKLTALGLVDPERLRLGVDVLPGEHLTRLFGE